MDSRAKVLLVAALAATLALLLAHALYYEFLTDDAYISFRYARNLSQGHGLVFNPGFERVEGYSNFLWVLLLAAAHFLGLSIQGSAPVLSLAATVALWAVVVRFSWTHTPEARRAWVVLPALLLACTRSVAVWSTGGLETRLFELLVVAGVLRLVDEVGRRGRVFPLAAVLLALCTLTRPDGLLISGCAFLAAVLMSWRSLGARIRWLVASSAVYVALVGGHTLFRFLYYGAWLPNTYYAKVGGRLWWDMGAAYIGSFILEYGVYLWLPFLVAAVMHHRRRGTALVPVLFAAVVVPHAVYILSIGGDHFEYRPLDLYFPFAYLLIQSGAMALARSVKTTTAVLAALAVVLFVTVDIPWRSHRQFAVDYQPGFPGVILHNYSVGSGTTEDAETAGRYLAPQRMGLYRLPGLQWIAGAYQQLVRWTTRHYVGIRQEEHRLFLAGALEEGRALAALVEEGRLPKNSHLALDCVGAIPFHADVRVLDRLGLTDAHVARGEFSNPGFMAHGKRATAGYAVQKGVDLWPVDEVHLLWDAREPEFALEAARLSITRTDAYFAEVGGQRYALAMLPQGLEETSRRLPRLRLRSVGDAVALGDVGRQAILLHPDHPGVHAGLGLALDLLGDAEQAEPHYRMAIAADPVNLPLRNNLAHVLARQGRFDEAATLLGQAILEQPDDAEPVFGLGNVFLMSGDATRARQLFLRALELAPGHEKALQGLAVLNAQETSAPSPPDNR